MIKNTRFTKKTLDYQSKVTHSENGQKERCNTNIDIAQLIVNQRQRKREIAATLVFVFTGH